MLERANVELITLVAMNGISIKDHHEANVPGLSTVQMLLSGARAFFNCTKENDIFIIQCMTDPLSVDDFNYIIAHEFGHAMSHKHDRSYFKHVEKVLEERRVHGQISFLTEKTMTYVAQREELTADLIAYATLDILCMPKPESLFSSIAYYNSILSEDMKDEANRIADNVVKCINFGPQ